MAKIKLQRFELLSVLEDGDKLSDFLQHFGCVHIEKVQDVKDENIHFQDLSETVNTFKSKKEKAETAVEILETSCKLKKNFIESLKDYKELEMFQYKQLCEDAESNFLKCCEICDIKEELDEIQQEIGKKKILLDKYSPWESLDIPMSSSQTSSCAIFIGSFKLQKTSKMLLEEIYSYLKKEVAVDAKIIFSDAFQTCAFIICHKSDEADVKNALSALGFMKAENPAKKLVSKAKQDIEAEIQKLFEKAEIKRNSLMEYVPYYDEIRFLTDFYEILTEKYEAVSRSVTTDSTIYFEGYVPERYSEELKFEIEKRFTAQIEIFDAEYDKYDVPVLIENRSMAQSVENITDMYAHPSNKDIDPNFIMSLFYFILFGLMLADGGYGLLMIAFALVAKLKFKVRGEKKVFANFALYCGISTTVWGALFGGWFGDLIPVISTEFLGRETAVDLAIWFNPQVESVKMMLFSFLFGIIHVFTGLAIRFYNLCKNKNIIGAFCDVIPVYAFVSGFAVIGKDFIEPVSDKTKDIGIKLLIVGAVLIVLTSGRSAKNILGKLGGGIYGLYNTTTGYLGDILSYARLLALNLVTSVIAMVVNQLAAMPKNIIVFILIFVLGHSINLGINLIGTYVHTNRLQYVEFFSKFYEGGGRSFTPLRINAKYFKFKEDTINGRNYE